MLNSRRWPWTALWLIAGLAPGPGSALASVQTPDNASTLLPPVTVVAPPTAAQKKTLQDETRDFVQSYGAPTARLGQLARWKAPICVITAGLSAKDNAMVSGRVRDVAKSIGVEINRSATCIANVEVIFTDQTQQFMDLVARKRASLLGYHFRNETDRIKTITHPIQAWYLTATTNRSDEQIDEVSGAGMGGIVNSLAYGHGPGGCAGSAFTECLRSVFFNVLVVADSSKLDIHAMGPVADYVAMVALSQPKSLDQCGSLDSIMDLMASGCVADRPKPVALTTTDMAYLKALYAANPELKMSMAKGNLANHMARIIETGDIDHK